MDKIWTVLNAGIILGTVVVLVAVIHKVTSKQ